MSDVDKPMRYVAEIAIDSQNPRHCSLRCPQLIGRGYEDGYRCTLFREARGADRRLGSNWGKPYRCGMCMESATEPGVAHG